MWTFISLRAECFDYRLLMDNVICLTGEQHRHLARVHDQQHRAVQVHVIAQHSGRTGADIYVDQAEHHRDENVRNDAGENEKLKS